MSNLDICVSTKTMLDLTRKYNTNEKYKGPIIGMYMAYKRNGKLSNKQFFLLKKIFKELNI